MAVHRGQHVGTAAAPTVRGLATVDQPEIVTDALPVKAHVEIAAGGSRHLKIRLYAGRARTQRLKSEYAAAVRRELCDLLARDDAANLAGIGLDCDGVRLYCDGLLRAAQGEGEVHAGAITNSQDEVLALANFETRRFDAHDVLANV